MRRALDDYGAGVLDTPDGWVWSDLHLGHANIIRYTGRPFRDAAEMDAALWAAWTETVGPEDPLVCVGDVAMGRALREETWHRVRAAPGRPKVLVAGNHDLTGSGRLRVAGFDRVRPLVLAPGDPPLVFTHVPLSRVPDGLVNVHGHRHEIAGPPGAPCINVSVEQLGYRPVALARLRRLARAILDGHAPAGTTTLERLSRVERGG